MEKQELSRLKAEIEQTLAGPPLDRDRLIEACDDVSRSLTPEEHLPLLRAMGLSERRARDELQTAKTILSGEYLRARVRVELGDGGERVLYPLDCAAAVRQRRYPLGVLFHIAAGNMEGLPVFSALEGMLAGNVNLLKLPGGDSGISRLLLGELTGRYPLIGRYVYAFDFSSAQIEQMRALASLADAVVVWGGDEAIRSVRALADVNSRIIEWGHKISFAYATGAGATQDNLRSLARHICETRQTLCSSCQGLFVDTDSREEVEAVAHALFAALCEESARSDYYPVPDAVAAKITLHLQTERLMRPQTGRLILSEPGCSVIADSTAELESSYMFGNCWVRPLPRGEIIRILHPHRNHLQTAALLCGPQEREALCEALARAGVVRVTGPENPSRTYCGQPHDGLFALRQYSRVVSLEIENGTAAAGAER